MVACHRLVPQNIMQIVQIVKFTARKYSRKDVWDGLSKTTVKIKALNQKETSTFLSMFSCFKMPSTRSLILYEVCFVKATNKIFLALQMLNLLNMSLIVPSHPGQLLHLFVLSSTDSKFIMNRLDNARLNELLKQASIVQNNLQHLDDLSSSDL